MHYNFNQVHQMKQLIDPIELPPNNMNLAIIMNTILAKRYKLQ